MKVIRVLSLFCLFALVFNLSCGPSKRASVEVSVGQQAYDKGDYAAALKVFQPLARQGNPDSQNYIGILYHNGQGVPRDYKEAAKWYRLASKQGNSYAQNNLGILYASGSGVPQDYTEAAKWYRLAAEQRNPDAQDSLGGLYEQGQGVPQDYKEAAKWYRLAAEGGNQPAQLNLGEKYLEGEGVPQNYNEAIRWFRQAAEQGNSTAQLNLGLLYKVGFGEVTRRDYSEAVKWYHLAADQGESNAQRNLADMYENGNGVLQDYVKAHLWYNLAAANGDAEGIKNRDRIAHKLTPAQLTEAQRLALEWRPTSSADQKPNPALAHLFANAGAHSPVPTTAAPSSLADDLLKAAPPAHPPVPTTAVPATSTTGKVFTFDASEVDATPAPAVITAATPVHHLGGDALDTGMKTQKSPPQTANPLDRSPVPQTAYPLHSIRDAELAGWVRTSYRSHEGSSSGDSIVLIVAKISGPDKLALSIPPGLALQSPLLSSQSMVISGLKGREIAGGKYTPEESILLTDDKPARYVIEAYCAEFHKDNPPPDKSDFRVAATPDPELACILNGARKEKLSIAGTQAAVWIHTDHVTFSEMNTRMGIDKEEWSKAEIVASRCNSNR
jgi:TPR repeat protein